MKRVRNEITPGIYHLHLKGMNILKAPLYQKQMLFHTAKFAEAIFGWSKIKGGISSEISSCKNIVFNWPTDDR